MVKGPSIDLTKQTLNYIYILIKNGIPFYIGKTHYPKRRESEHKSKYGNDIDMMILKAVKGNDWKKYEIEWINIIKSWKLSINNINAGGGGPEKGISRSPKFGDNISKSKKGKSRPKNELIPATLAKQKIVLQYDLEGNYIQEFPSAKSASKKINIHYNNMYAHLKGKYKTAKGYIFKYKH